MSSVGDLTRGNTVAAKSGRPPRETTAPMRPPSEISDRRPAQIRLAQNPAGRIQQPVG